jgi:DNA-binding CsgD family transcriptional regulator
MSRRRLSNRDRTADAALQAVINDSDPLVAAFKDLSELEKNVLVLRFVGTSFSLIEIGKIFGLTPERVRQIESKAMSKLRHPKRNHYFREYFLEFSGDLRLKSAIFQSFSEKTGPMLASQAQAELDQADWLWRRQHGTDCVQCGERFTPKRSGRPAKFCSNACRQTSYRTRRTTRRATP